VNASVLSALLAGGTVLLACGARTCTAELGMTFFVVELELWWLDIVAKPVWSVVVVPML
jgi:hypothetical protein